MHRHSSDIEDGENVFLLLFKINNCMLQSLLEIQSAENCANCCSLGAAGASRSVAEHRWF